MSRAALLVALGLLAACGPRQHDSGATGMIQVAGAVHYLRELEAPDGGPQVAELTAITTVVRAGQPQKVFSGSVARTDSVALSFSGEPGFWLLPTDVVDPADPSRVTFSAQVSFSERLLPGRYELVARGIDAEGRAGPPFALPLDVIGREAPLGELVISLMWATRADLDLHVVIPDGVEIWAGNINSYAPPNTGGIIDPEAAASGGVLLQDANAGCRGDALGAEHVVWTRPPPRGRYRIRVSTASLCGERSAYWGVSVVRGRRGEREPGVILGSTLGTSLESDTRQGPARGAGQLALEFEIP